MKKIYEKIESVLLCYIVLVIVLFDMTKIANKHDVDNDKFARPVAFGPRPRRFFCRPGWENTAYYGTEWVYRVRIFDPVFYVWCKAGGFVRPVRPYGEIHQNDTVK